jgi:hypothetical protein
MSTTKPARWLTILTFLSGSLLWLLGAYEAVLLFRGIHGNRIGFVVWVVVLLGMSALAVWQGVAAKASRGVLEDGLLGLLVGLALASVAVIVKGHILSSVLRLHDSSLVPLFLIGALLLMYALRRMRST